mgnify:CR=1 FL=1
MPVKYYLDKRLNKKDEAPIRITAVVNGTRILSTTGFCIKPGDWDDKSKRVAPHKTNSKKQTAAQINKWLNGVEGVVLDFENTCKGRPTVEKLRNVISSYNPDAGLDEAEEVVEPQRPCVMDYFKEFLREESISNQWTPGTMQIWNAFGKHLQAVVKRSTFDFYNNGINAFVRHLRVKAKMQENSVQKHYLNLRWFLKWAIRQGYASEKEIGKIQPKFKLVDKPVIQYIVEEAVATADISRSADAEELLKTGEDMAKIAAMTFSATKLETYVGCQAQFYYKYIRELKPEGEVKETLDPSLEGTVCHETLQEIYSEGGKLITAEFLKGWLSRKGEIKRRVLAGISKYLKSIEVGGQDLVTAEILVRFITKAIECDLRLVEANGPIRIIGLECPMEVEIGGHKFFRYIDRIHSFREGMVRVVDYKTGSDRQDALLLSKSPDAFKSENKAALQFFIYDRMIAGKEEFAGKSVFNSMYAMKSFFTEGVKIVPANEEFGRELEEAVSQTIADIEDSTKPFERTSQVRKCTYCDYCELCGRAK